MEPKTLHIVAVSGGKDSTATLLLVRDRLPKTVIRPVFVDTGNEHAETYAYLDVLESRLDLPITRLRPDFSAQIAEKRRFIANDRRTGRDRHGVKHRWSNRRKREALSVLHPTGNPFLDLCLLKGMFPSNRSRFCTEHLKKNVFVGYVDDLVQSGQRVVVWQGIRREESDKRKHARKIERVGPGFYYFRPLVDWTEADVFRFLAAQGIPPNPLYQRLGRVSCAPCIYSSKPDLRVLLTPDVVDRIRLWESLVSQASKTGQAAFFAGKQLAGARLGKVNPLVFWDRHRIDAIQHWAAKPTRFNPADWDGFASADDKACSSEWGLCD